MRVKVLLITDETTELEKLYNDGWKVDASFIHPKGVLLVLAKDIVALVNDKVRG